MAMTVSVHGLVSDAIPPSPIAWSSVYLPSDRTTRASAAVFGISRRLRSSAAGVYDGGAVMLSTRRRGAAAAGNGRGPMGTHHGMTDCSEFGFGVFGPQSQGPPRPERVERKTKPTRSLGSPGGACTTSRISPPMREGSCFVL